MRRLAAFLMLLAATASAETYTVTSGADDGSVGTLRWAIDAANAHPGADFVSFTVTTIRPLSPLPEIGEGDHLSGVFGGHAGVEVDGSQAGAGPGLVLRSGAGISGITVNRFAGNGIEVRGSSSTVNQCRVGTTADGTAAPVGGDALLITGHANTVVFSVFGASATGIRVVGNDNLLFGNHVGVGTRGEQLGNRGDGIVVESGATGNQIGRALGYCILCGVRPGPNIVGFNGGHGVVIGGNRNSVINNFSGTTADGRPAGNGGSGIVVTGRGNAVQHNGTSFNGGSGLVFMAATETAVAWHRGGCNAQLLIDAGGDGPTANDPGDFDGFTNRPFVTTAVADAGATFIDGTLEARPDSSYLINVYVPETACSQPGRNVDRFSIQTDLHGRAAFQLPIMLVAPRVALTATDAAGNVSELSPHAESVQRGNATADFAVQLEAERTAATVGETIRVRLTVTNNGPAAAPMAWPSFDWGGSRPVGVTDPACYPWCALGPGGSATWIYELRITASGILHLATTLRVPTSYRDPEPANNAASAEIVVAPPRRRASR